MWVCSVFADIVAIVNSIAFADDWTHVVAAHRQKIHPEKKTIKTNQANKSQRIQFQAIADEQSGKKCSNCGD